MSKRKSNPKPEGLVKPPPPPAPPPKRLIREDVRIITNIVGFLCKVKEKKMKTISKEEHQGSVCYHNCIQKKKWTREMPYIVTTDEQTRTLFICLSCVHFVGFDNFIKEV